MAAAGDAAGSAADGGARPAWLFLDVDGVLCLPRAARGALLKPSALEALAHLFQRARQELGVDIELIVSSTWRKQPKKLKQLAAAFEKHDPERARLPHFGPGIARTTAPFSIFFAKMEKLEPRKILVTSQISNGILKSGLSLPNFSIESAKGICRKLGSITLSENSSKTPLITGSTASKTSCC